ncbi:MFS transporter [Novosphingobium olei]|uniref:MFS transporter n=1 Tax=Novosphingobium olei TaxID=2728851 RepID=UPI0030854226|nr:MFS transporter [Novosphingobium olei]
MRGAVRGIGGGVLTVALTIGSVGLLVLGLQPLLLGGLVLERRISEAEIGNLVTVEMLAIALGSLAGVWLFRRANPRAVAILAAIGLAAVDLLCIGGGHDAWLLLLRGAAGLCEGVLVAAALVAIALSAHVERASALFLAGQTLLQAIVAFTLPYVEGAGSAADHVFAALAGAAVLAALLALAVPSTMRPVAADESGGALSTASLVALCCSGLFLGAIVTTWSYLGIWLAKNGHSAKFEGLIVASSLVAQIAGASIAARWGERLHYRTAIAGGALVAGLLIAGFFLARESSAGLVLVGVCFGFVWLFVPPFFAGWLIEIDPARRAVLYLTAFQLGGAAFLPSAAALLVDRWSVDAALWSSGGIFILLSLIVYAATAGNRRAAA